MRRSPTCRGCCSWRSGRRCSSLAVRFLTGPRLFAVGVLLATVELAGGNISLLLAVAIVVGFRWPAAWAFVLLTKVTPGIGLLWFVVRREWRSARDRPRRDRARGRRLGDLHAPGLARLVRPADRASPGATARGRRSRSRSWSGSRSPSRSSSGAPARTVAGRSRSPAMLALPALWYGGLTMLLRSSPCATRDRDRRRSHRGFDRPHRTQRATALTPGARSGASRGLPAPTRRPRGAPRSPTAAAQRGTPRHRRRTARRRRATAATPAPIAGPDDPGRVERQVDEVEGRRAALRRHLGGEQAEDHRAHRRGRRARGPRRASASDATDGASGISSSDDARARRATRRAPAGTRSGRRARRRAARRAAPTSAAVPATRPIAEARPGPVPVSPSTRTGMYGRLIWVAR